MGWLALQVGCPVPRRHMTAIEEDPCRLNLTRTTVAKLLAQCELGGLEVEVQGGQDALGDANTVCGRKGRSSTTTLLEFFAAAARAGVVAANFGCGTTHGHRRRREGGRRRKRRLWGRPLPGQELEIV